MFEKGNKYGVGNAGRPKLGAAVARKVRELGGDDGATYLNQLHWIATATHDDLRARMTAIEILLDRGWGKPPQEMDVQMGGEGTDLSTVSDEELEARTVALLRRIRGQQPDTDDDDEPSRTH